MIDEGNTNVSRLNVLIKTKIVKLCIITKPNCLPFRNASLKGSEIFKSNEGKRYAMRVII